MKSRRLWQWAQPLAFWTLLFSSVSFAAGQTGLGQIGLNDTVSGTTIGADSRGYSAFNTEEIGGAGQVFYTGNVLEGEWDVTFSTCAAASFDTYLVIFSGNAFTQNKILGEANNDPTCSEDFKRSKTTVRLRPGPYTVLLTGVGIEQGTFTLQSSAKIPQTLSLVPWGLDRIDQRQLPLDDQYKVPELGTNGAGISVYVLDSGVRGSHEEFEGRVTDGFDFVSHSQVVKDCTGLGTSAAGVIAGKTLGVAKAAKIVSVRIIDCDNKAQINHVTSALEWVILNVQFQPSRQVPAVIFLRFHSGTNAEVDKAVASVTKFGIPVIAPAGDNDNGEYCSETSPATSGSAIMVGSTDQDDYKSARSNYGSCTSLFAPGNNITAASFTSDTAVEPASGTAIAAAHVAGAVALLLDMNSGASPRDLGSILSSLGTVDVVQNGTGRGSANAASKEGLDDFTPRLAFVRSIPSLFGDRSAGEIPPEQTIFLYFMVNYTDIETSAVDACGATTLKAKMETVLDTEEEDLSALCTGETAVYRVNTVERQAAGVSSKVSSALGENIDESTKALGTKFVVVEEPWFVDAQGFIYWSEPQFQKADKNAFTVGAIVGIAVGALLLVVVLGVFGYASTRYLRGVDDIESMEGSADFERGPTHFNDFANHDGPRESSAQQVARSFRNVFSGLSKSLSIRGDGGGLGRQSSRRGESDAGGGISRMDSYMGQVRGADQGGGTDMMRMKSYGGEAFAGLGAVSRSNSMRSVDSNATSGAGKSSSGLNGDQRAASFRGRGALLGLVNNRQNSNFGLDPAGDLGDGNDGRGSMSDVRMQSMGGEAFAMLTRELSEVGRRESPRVGSSRRGAQAASASAKNEQPTKQGSYGPETLAPSDEEDIEREPSFFTSGGGLQ